LSEASPWLTNNNGRLIKDRTPAIGVGQIHNRFAYPVTFDYLKAREKAVTTMAWNSASLALLGGVGLFIVYRLVTHFKSAQRPPLPPGPKPQFLVGNLGDLPKPGEQEWAHWLKHKDLYGLYSHGQALEHFANEVQVELARLPLWGKRLLSFMMFVWLLS
jgi:hypothetical protein